MRPERIPLSGADPRLYALLSSLLEHGADVRIQVTGRSMYPALSSGDVVVVKKPGKSPLKRGDIVLVRGNTGTLLLHRLVSVRGVRDNIQVRTRGDAVRSCDGWIDMKEVLGKVITIEPRKGKIINLGKGVRPVLGFVAAVSGNARSSVLTLLSRTRRALFS